MSFLLLGKKGGRLGYSVYYFNISWPEATWEGKGLLQITVNNPTEGKTGQKLTQGPGGRN